MSGLTDSRMTEADENPAQSLQTKMDNRSTERGIERHKRDYLVVSLRTLAEHIAESENVQQMRNPTLHSRPLQAVFGNLTQVVRVPFL